MSVTISRESSIQLRQGREVERAFTRKGRGCEPAEVGVVLAKIVHMQQIGDTVGTAVEYVVWNMARREGDTAWDTFSGDYTFDADKAVAWFQARVQRELGLSITK